MSKMADALEKAILDNGGFTTAYFLVHEVMEDDGDRTLHYVWPDDQAYWTSLGMLYTAVDMLSAARDEDTDE
jgi:hypothetical protein